MRKTKRKFACCLVIAVLLSFAVTASGAAWYTCSIDMIGAADGAIFIRLTDTKSSPSFTDIWFLITGENAKEMLASGLTAVSMGKRVLVKLPETEQYSDVKAIYLVP